MRTFGTFIKDCPIWTYPGRKGFAISNLKAYVILLLISQIAPYQPLPSSPPHDPPPKSSTKTQVRNVHCFPHSSLNQVGK